MRWWPFPLPSLLTVSWAYPFSFFFFLFYPFFLCFTIAVNNNNKRGRKYHGCYRSSTTCAPNLSITKHDVISLAIHFFFFPAQHASWHTICFFFPLLLLLLLFFNKIESSRCRNKGCRGSGEREKHAGELYIYEQTPNVYIQKKKKTIRNNSEALHFEWHRSFTKDNIDAGDNKKKKDGKHKFASFLWSTFSLRLSFCVCFFFVVLLFP